MWPFSSRKVLIVSEKRREPALDSAFLHQPNIRLLTSYADADQLERFIECCNRHQRS